MLELALGMLIDLYELGVDVGEEIVDMDIEISND